MIDSMLEFFNMQFNTSCTVLRKFMTVPLKQLWSKVCYSVSQGCKKVTSSKNGRFWYEIIVDTQPEMEVLEVVESIYPFSLKQGAQSYLQTEFNSSTKQR